MNKNESNGDWKESWKTLPKNEPDRIIELIFAGAVVVFAFLGWRNAHSGSQQTDELISAAKISAYAARQNAQAARDFASSAAQINRGVSDAVTKLQMQASATEEARQSSEKNSRAALQAAIDNFQQEQRPWIGLQNFTCSNCKLERIEPRQLLQPPSETFSIGQLSGLIANTGKTPAVQVEFDAAITTRRAKDPIPNWDSIQKESVQRIRIEDRDEILKAEKEASPPAVMPPSYSQWYPLIQRFGATRERTSPRDSERIYAVGKITYLDVRRKMLYVTTFCLVDIWWTSGENSFQFCSEGNDMK